MSKRDLFEELMQGVREMAAARVEAASASKRDGCYRVSNHLDSDPTLTVVAPSHPPVLDCPNPCIDQKAGRNDRTDDLR